MSALAPGVLPFCGKTSLAAPVVRMTYPVDDEGSATRK